MRSKIFDKFEGGLILMNFLRKLLITNKIGIRHIPFLGHSKSNNHKDDDYEVYLAHILLC